MNSSGRDGAESWRSDGFTSCQDKKYSSPVREGQSGARNISPELNASPGVGRDKNIVALSKRGHRLLKGKQFQQAREVFTRARELDGHNPYILSGLGECLKNLGEIPAAGACYEKLLEQEPDNLFALRGLGDIYKLGKDYERAIVLWCAYLNYRANDIYVLTRIADGYKMLGRSAEAEDYYRRILTLNPADQFSLMGLADLYHKTGRERQAVDYYEKVLEQAPRLINILTIVGTLYTQFRDFENALRCYGRALELEPTNSYALHGMGNCYRWKRDYQRAIQYWEPLVDSEGVTVALLSRLGDMYRNVERFAEAEKIYLRGLESGYDKYALLGLVKLRCLQGREEEVRSRFDEFIRREGFELRVVEALAALFVQTGRVDAAVRFCRQLLERNDLKAGDAGLLEAKLSRWGEGGKEQPASRPVH